MPKDTLSKLLFVCGIALSTIAVIIAVKGMMAIFPTSEIIVPTMIGILEVTKLVLAIWVHSNWSSISFMIKSYMSMALVVLMLMTSLSIFGFLSKTHLDQNLPSGDITAKLQIIDERITIEEEVISQYRKDLGTLNTQIDRYNELGAVSKGVKVRERQRVERDLIFKKIEDGQSKITSLREKRSPIAHEVRKVEAEVGPLKYIAALIYGDSLDVSLLEKSVRIVILMIVFVFDPLAVLILISVTKNNTRVREEPSVIEARVIPEEPIEEEIQASIMDIQLSEDVMVQDNITIGITKNN